MTNQVGSILVLIGLARKRGIIKQTDVRTMTKEGRKLYKKFLTSEYNTNENLLTCYDKFLNSIKL